MDALAVELLRRFPTALGEAAPIQWTCSFDHLFAGLTMLADWLGSSLPVAGDDWRPAAVASLLDSLPWSGWHSGAPATAILPGAPIGAQVVMGAVPLTERLVVIEAPTGTGKTEAALLRALQLVEAGLVDGMYFALPTRAAATEAHARIARLARTHSPALASRVVRALAGNLGTDGVARAVPGVLDPDQWQQAKSWAIACPKRVMAAPIAVGTIDQAMLSVLRTRHAYRELLAAGVPTMLHHSRYADLDRQTLDARLVGVIGKGGTRTPLAIVATQTAEQSLDIDADLLVSDPAPADVLLQRRGRLGRHRPTAVLPMLVLEPRAVEETAAVALRRALGHQGQMPIGSEWAYVYDVLATLATLEALRGRDCILVPDAVRQLVETATHPDALQAFAGRRGWSPLWQETWGRRLAQRQLAQGGLLDWSRPSAEQPVTEAVPTRLGEGTVTVELRADAGRNAIAVPLSRCMGRWRTALRASARPRWRRLPREKSLCDAARSVRAFVISLSWQCCKTAPWPRRRRPPWRGTVVMTDHGSTMAQPWS